MTTTAKPAPGTATRSEEVMQKQLLRRGQTETARVRGLSTFMTPLWLIAAIGE